MDGLREFVAIAKIAKPRGLRGEVVANVLTGFPERFENQERVFVVKSDSKTRELEIERFWFQKNRIILKFIGVDSIEDAETLRDFEVCILESEVVDLVEDEFFDWELQGCRVETIQGKLLGKAREIMRTGASEILVVESIDDAKKDYLIPFVKAICTEVDIENKLIKVDAPDGLLEF